MDNSFLAVSNINHKYIVVEKRNLWKNNQQPNYSIFLITSTKGHECVHQRICCNRFSRSSIPEYIAEHSIAIADVVHRCRGILSKSYVYDILNGTKRNPSRDVVLLLCIAVHADRKQTRRLLEKYGHRDLYAKDTRDIIIATYINNKEYDIDRINDELFQYHLSPLSTEH